MFPTELLDFDVEMVVRVIAELSIERRDLCSLARRWLIEDYYEYLLHRPYDNDGNGKGGSSQAEAQGTDSRKSVDVLEAYRVTCKKYESGLRALVLEKRMFEQKLASIRSRTQEVSRYINSIHLEA